MRIRYKVLAFLPRFSIGQNGSEAYAWTIAPVTQRSCLQFKDNVSELVSLQNVAPNRTDINYIGYFDLDWSNRQVERTSYCRF